MESHNHPTALEPYQGAATGVGGIMRDIFTMGARPFCSLNLLRFGHVEGIGSSKQQRKNHYLFVEAVKGIGDYGNSLGVAVAGGELFFDSSYDHNCLVNAMSVGIVRHENLAKAMTGAVGNPVFVVGASTGRDGIHGASFASKNIETQDRSERSAVQVGDPFMEKLLMEATLELLATDCVAGIQDMGAAGLSCCSAEMSAKSNTGIKLNLDHVPLREEGMTPYEIMLSESQERMLVVVKLGKEKEVIDICKKWDVPIALVGEVITEPIIEVWQNNELYASIPSHSLVLGGGAPQYNPAHTRPSYLDELEKVKIPNEHLKIEEAPILLQEAFLQLLSSSNICSRRFVYEQYDTEVGLASIYGPGGNGGLYRSLDAPDKGIAVSVDCNSRYVYLNPFVGAAQAVCESARNVACLGAEPIGITNCLNFGNPTVPENYYMFVESIKGISAACKKLDIPVTGGNVSFYNESENGSILPTPAIGMVGLLPSIKNAVPSVIPKSNLQILFVGDFNPSLGGSEFHYNKTQRIESAIPKLDLEKELALIQFLNKGADQGLFCSAHDLSLGGLSVALFRSAYNSYTRTCQGFSLEENGMNRLYDLAHKDLNQLFFGESNASVLLSIEEEQFSTDFFASK